MNVDQAITCPLLFQPGSTESSFKDIWNEAKTQSIIAQSITYQWGLC